MVKSEATRIKAAIVGAKVDRVGQWTMTLEVPESDGVKVAALALHAEEVFDVVFYAEQ